jgi:hypothetical protein
MKTSNKVHLNSTQFGFMKPGQFEEVMRKIARANDIPIICSCGVCTVDEVGALALTALLHQASQANRTVNAISEKISSEGYYINMAATGRSHDVDTSEEHLRQF